MSDEDPDIDFSSEGAVYTCKACGCHDFVVENEYILDRTVYEHIECSCGNADDGIAAERTTVFSSMHKCWGPLDDEHRWEYDEQEVLEDSLHEEEIESEVYCQDCAESGEWIREDNDPPEGEVSDNDFYVRCAKCDREIEFGWSHPGRAGRIWPAESSDFNPWMSWPEHKYRDNWAKKGWLRPNSALPSR